MKRSSLWGNVTQVWERWFGVGIRALSVLVGSSFFAPAVLQGQERDLNVVVGGAIGLESGFDQTEVELVPLFDVRYQLADTEVFLSVFDGIGINYSPEGWGASLSVAVKPGEGRAQPSGALENEPAISSLFSASIGVGVGIPLGEITASVGYFPVMIQPKKAPEALASALTYLLGWGWEQRWGPIRVSFGTSMTFIDGCFAETYYSAKHSVGYIAQAGFEKVSVSTQAVVFFTDNLGAGASADLSRYSDQLARSPFLSSGTRLEASVGLFYQFR